MSHHRPQYHEACFEAVRDQLEASTVEHEQALKLWGRDMKELGKELTKKQMDKIYAYAESILLGA
jgi:predicted transcriptional regulator